MGIFAPKTKKHSATSGMDQQGTFCTIAAEDF